MYDAECGLIVCDACEEAVQGCGYSVSRDGGDPEGCYCWECALEEIDQQLNDDNKEVTIARRSENWYRCMYDMGVRV